MKITKIIMMCGATLCLTQSLFSQLSKVDEPAYRPTREQQIWMDGAKRNESRMGGKDEDGFIKQPTESRGTYEPFEGSREREAERIAAANAVALADVAEINRKMTAPREYLNKYPEYTTGKNVGIFRLYPNQNCGTGKIVDVKELERCGNLPQILGFGSKTSFSLSAVPTDFVKSIGLLFAYPDLEYRDNKLYAGNPLTETLITELGNADLGKIDSKTAEIQFLTKWKKSSNRKDVVAHRKLIENGINENNRLYSSNAPVRLNSAYALRSIAYYNKYKMYWNNDLVVAFKIVAQENDGSVIIIWKQLQKKGAPEIKR